MEFPQYRKYANGLSYFKITDAGEFIEIQVLGKFYLESHFVAKILPDRNHISDLIVADGERVMIIDEKEFDAFLVMVKRDKQQMFL